MYRAVQCSQEYFGNSSQARELFESWRGFSLICPDLDAHEMIKLQNTHGDMFNKHFSFRVERCVNSTANGNNCHSDEMIDQYISDASINGWVLQNNLVMRDKMHHNPIYKSQKLWLHSLLGEKTAKQYNINL